MIKLIQFSLDCQNRWPQVVTFDDWADVFRVAEFEKESESSYGQSGHNDNGDRGGCVFFLFLLIVLLLYYYFILTKGHFDHDFPFSYV